MAIRPPMTSVIAERTLEVILPDGKEDTLTIQIGRPARDPNPGGNWHCPVRMRRMGKEEVRSHYGIDPLQALQFTLGILDLRVRAFAEPCRLSWLGQPDLGLEPWVPKQKLKKARTTKSSVRRKPRRR
jgi:hypothetical protein